MSGNSPRSGGASSPSTPPPIYTSNHSLVSGILSAGAPGGDSSPLLPTPSGTGSGSGGNATSVVLPPPLPAFQPLRPRSSSNLSNSARRSLSPQVGLGGMLSASGVTTVRAVIGFNAVAVEPPLEWEGAVREVESIDAAVAAAFELAKGEPAVVRNLSRLTSTMPGASLFPPTLVMGGTSSALHHLGSTSSNISGAATPAPAPAHAMQHQTSAPTAAAPLIQTRHSRLLPLQDGSRTAPFPEVLFETCDGSGGNNTLVVAEGYGTLRDATTGMVLYQGLWRAGMRHGKGRSAIFEALHDGHHNNHYSLSSHHHHHREQHYAGGEGSDLSGLHTPAIASGVGAGRYVSSQSSSANAAAAAASSLTAHAVSSSSYFRYLGEYSGDHFCGLRHGAGVFNVEGGDKYDGQWHGDFKQGTGTETVLGGGVYKGTWWRGCRHGCGVFSFPTGGTGGGVRTEHREYERGVMVSSHASPPPALPSSAESSVGSPMAFGNNMMGSPSGFQQVMTIIAALQQQQQQLMQLQQAGGSLGGQLAMPMPIQPGAGLSGQPSSALSRTASFPNALSQLSQLSNLSNAANAATAAANAAAAAAASAATAAAEVAASSSSSSAFAPAQSPQTTGTATGGTAATGTGAHAATSTSGASATGASGGSHATAVPSKDQAQGIAATGAVTAVGTRAPAASSSTGGPVPSAAAPSGAAPSSSSLVSVPSFFASGHHHHHNPFGLGMGGMAVAVQEAMISSSKVAVQHLLRHSTVADVPGGSTSGTPGGIVTVRLTDTVETCLTRLTEKNVLSVPVFDETAGKYVAIIHILDILSFMLDLVNKKKATFSPMQGASLRETLAHQRRFATAPLSEVLAMRQHVTSTAFTPLPAGAPLLMAAQVLATGVHAIPIIESSGAAPLAVNTTTTAGAAGPTTAAAADGVSSTSTSPHSAGSTSTSSTPAAASFAAASPPASPSHAAGSSASVTAAPPAVGSGGRILRMLTQADIIRFLAAHIEELGPLATCTLQDLGLKGSPECAVIARFSDKAIDVFLDMQRRKAPASAIVDAYESMVANLSFSDLKTIARKSNFSALQLNLQQFLSAIEKGSEVINPSLYMKPSSTLSSLLLRLASSKVHGVWSVDDSLRPVAALRITDVLKFIVTE